MKRKMVFLILFQSFSSVFSSFSSLFSIFSLSFFLSALNFFPPALHFLPHQFYPAFFCNNIHPCPSFGSSRLGSPWFMFPPVQVPPKFRFPPGLGSLLVQVPSWFRLPPVQVSPITFHFPNLMLFGTSMSNFSQIGTEMAILTHLSKLTDQSIKQPTTCSRQNNLNYTFFKSGG